MKTNNTALKRSISRKVSKAIRLAAPRVKPSNSGENSCLNDKVRATFYRG